MFPPGIEPGTFRVLGGCDNHYTTETSNGCVFVVSQLVYSVLKIRTIFVLVTIFTNNKKLLNILISRAPFILNKGVV